MPLIVIMSAIHSRRLHKSHRFLANSCELSHNSSMIAVPPIWLMILSFQISISSAIPTNPTPKIAFLEFRPSAPILKRELQIFPIGRVSNVNSNGVSLYEFPTCASDPSYATRPSAFTDGQGTLQSTSCDNGLSRDAHCWWAIPLFSH